MEIISVWAVRDGIPELIIAWDYYTYDQNRDGFEMAKEDTLEAYPEYMQKNAQEIKMKVDREELEKILKETPEVETKIKDES